MGKNTSAVFELWFSIWALCVSVPVEILSMFLCLDFFNTTLLYQLSFFMLLVQVTN